VAFSGRAERPGLSPDLGEPPQLGERAVDRGVVGHHDRGGRFGLSLTPSSFARAEGLGEGGDGGSIGGGQGEGAVAVFDQDVLDAGAGGGGVGARADRGVGVGAAVGHDDVSGRAEVDDMGGVGAGDVGSEEVAEGTDVGGWVGVDRVVGDSSSWPISPAPRPDFAANSASYLRSRTATVGSSMTGAASPRPSSFLFPPISSKR